MRLLISLCFLVLVAACSSEPKLHTIGTVEMEKLITPKDLAELDYTAFREKYLGKEVTLTGFDHAILIGSYKNHYQCELGLRVKDDESKLKFSVKLFTNHQPDFVIKDILKSHDDFQPELLSYSEEIKLPGKGMCEDICEFNVKAGSCLYKSPNFTVTGKIFQTAGEDGIEGAILYIKAKGIAY